MQLSPSARRKLQQILRACVREKSRKRTGPPIGYTFLTPRIAGNPMDFSQEIPVGGIGSIGLMTECLDSLAEEEGLRYLTSDQMRDAVYALAQAVHIDTTGRYKQPQFVDNLIDTFVGQYMRDVVEYAIAFVISGPVVEGSTLSLGDGVLSLWSEEDAAAWGIAGEDREHFLGRTVMVVSARGVTEEIAIERGRIAMEANLGILRACIGYADSLELLLTKKHPNPITQGKNKEAVPTIYEYQLFFQWTGDLAYRDSGSSAESTIRRFHSPEITEICLTGQLFDYVSETLAYLNTYFGDGTKTYSQEYRRALEWIGSSMTRTNPDDKVVDLCTALECVLCNESDGRKGELLTIRQMVLADTVGSGPSFETPHVLYGEYLLRNKVIHGAATRVCTHHHAASLTRVALSVMVAVLQLVEQTGEHFHQGLTTHHIPGWAKGCHTANPMGAEPGILPGGSARGL